MDEILAVKVQCSISPPRFRGGRGTPGLSGEPLDSRSEASSGGEYTDRWEVSWKIGKAKIAYLGVGADLGKRSAEAGAM